MNDGDYVVSLKTLERLGHGDAAAGRRLLRVLIDVESMREPVHGPVERPANVRLANEADEDSIIELLRADHAENAAMVAPFDEQHVRSFVYSATREHTATIGVIDGDHGVVGMIFLVPEIWWFASEWYVSERLMFVHPDHRRTRHAGSLIDFGRWFVTDMSRRLGYTVFMVSSVVGTHDVDRKVAVFGRKMQRGGGIFLFPSPL